MKILYVTYIDMDKPFSGSAVRPKKLLDAFLSSGHDVELLSGSFTKSEHSKRKKDVETIIKRINAGERFDLCYIESISGLLYKFYNKYEYDLWNTIKKANIPIGLFYRDIYWKFTDLFPVETIRDHITNFLCKIELNKICKIMDVVFVPSIEMTEYMPQTAKYVALPPGCEDYKLNDVKNEVPTFIYVGGTNYNYGTDLMLEAFALANTRKKIKLNLICRKTESEIINKFLSKHDEKPDWLNIIHASGKELQKYYSDSDYAVYSARRSEYYDFAIPVKLFEYISFEKPILCTDCKTLSKIVSQNGLGEVIECEIENFAAGILKIADSDAREYKKNLKNFKKLNSWDERIKLIVNSLKK